MGLRVRVSGVKGWSLWRLWRLNVGVLRRIWFGDVVRIHGEMCT
jgi:hypothetical protein